MYKDIKVLSFNIKTYKIELMNKDYIPVCIRHKDGVYSFDSIRQFCSVRVLSMNRANCKEILTSCGVEDRSDINICIMSRALSFRDNYWIKSELSNEKWCNINLYANSFSGQVAQVALTGVTDTIDMSDRLYTGELSNKGTRPKCFIRRDNDILLFKEETVEEIKSEIVSAVIASVLGLKSPTRYWYERLLERNCSVCKILTSESSELVHYRDIMSYNNEVIMSYNSSSYKFLMSLDTEQFLLMQIFDYITLNTDRNRDNFGVEMCNNDFVGLYPVYDHDSCFKGKGTNGLYFPTGITFNKTIKFLKSLNEYNLVRARVNRAVEYFSSDKFKEIFLKFKSLQIYELMLKRLKVL
ncbi:MAG: hypothetical protein K2M91_06880 [Lachnospiraceae bacterium]|nr:hypothetical protein [Lachnospiraceae bacterium]